MITKDMSVIESIKVINEYVDKAETFYLNYQDALKALRKASAFVRNGDIKQLVLKEI